MFDWHTVVYVLLIFSGAIILLLSIIRQKKLFDALAFIQEKKLPKVKRLLNIQKTLMIFFFLGYIIVAASFLFQLHLLSDFFVSLVFLFGAVFVLIGILVNLNMSDEIQTTIFGLLPICVHCKKIRYDKSETQEDQNWTEIENYISHKTDAKFSHGICPHCLKEMYPEYADKVMNQIDKP